MKAILFATVLVAAAMTALPAMSQSVVNVAVSEYQFNPAYLTITVGTTVVWTNVGQVSHEVEPMIDNPAGGHLATVVSLKNPTAPPSWEADLEPGDSFSYTFTEPGVYVLNCNEGGMHTAMKEVIVVN